MMRILFASLMGCLAVTGLAAEASAAGDARRGAQAYRSCVACHSLEPGRHLTGPSLANLLGKTAGRAEGFDRYSQPLKASGIVWDKNSLDAWLADPAAVVPGNYMRFQGMKDDRNRADLVALLEKALADNGTAAVVNGGLISAEFARGQVPEPVRNVGPTELVTAIRHCRQTFFVSTADGTETPHWAGNVRLKVDTGDTGPLAGKPVIVGAGMMGDRVSIIFADPSEIGRFIAKRCEP